MMDKYKYTCKYCGVYTTNAECICSHCKEKLSLIQKIKEIVFAIKRGESTEK